MFVSVQNSICGWKKNKKNFLGQIFKIFFVAIKKMPVIQFPYMGIVW